MLLIGERDRANSPPSHFTFLTPQAYSGITDEYNFYDHGHNNLLELDQANTLSKYSKIFQDR